MDTIWVKRNKGVALANRYVRELCDRLGIERNQAEEIFLVLSRYVLKNGVSAIEAEDLTEVQREELKLLCEGLLKEFMELDGITTTEEACGFLVEVAINLGMLRSEELMPGL